ncbi:MAG TPA: Rieske 2Fe-2S domain-containing protein [Chloroflexota bacterium]|nr:Rieske 2Fe-2S domain-containing protein [Chloroflexota bacterium]
MAEEWVTVAKTADVAEGDMLEVDLDGKAIAIANLGGSFYALAGECPHQGGPIAQGELEGDVVTCPWHNFRFEFKSGRTLDPPIGNCAKYQIRVEGSDLQLLNR